MGIVSTGNHPRRGVDDLKDAMCEKKFPSVIKARKTAIVLVHGNEEAVKGFSENSKSVTDERVRQSEASIDEIRATTAVPVTKQLLQMGRSAHTHYFTSLERSSKKRKRPRGSLLCRERKH